jgi:hypothetical protein
MNYILLIISFMLVLAIYLKYIKVKPPTIGVLQEQFLTSPMNTPDYMVGPIREQLKELKSEVNRPMNGTCDLYGAKPGSVHVPPAFLYHDKEVWIDNSLLKKKVRAIRKAVTDKGVWESNKMNTYIDNKKTKPYDTADRSYIENQSLSTSDTAVINPNVTHFDFYALSPTNPSPFSSVDGAPVVETGFMNSPKNYYEFSKEYGFRTYK